MGSARYPRPSTCDGRESGKEQIWNGRCAHFLYVHYFVRTLRLTGQHWGATTEGGVRRQVIEETLKRMLEPEVVASGCELWGIEYIDHPRSVVLKIYIEKQGGVNVDDCARVSEQVSAILDVEDPISGHYTLEVSSPGIDRRLFTAPQFESCKGEQVSVNLKSSVNGRRRFKGTLCGMEDDEVVVRIDDEEYLLPIEQIDKARVIPDLG